MKGDRDDYLCPMRFNGENRDDSRTCYGNICMWYDNDRRECKVSLIGRVPQPI